MKDYTGACICCCQIHIFKAGELEEKEINLEATKHCDCEGALEFQKIEQKKH